jgi:PAS domain S-box-containing protein
MSKRTPLTILLMDKETNTVNISGILTQNGHEVIVEPDGNKALDYLIDSSRIINMVMIDAQTLMADDHKIWELLTEKKLNYPFILLINHINPDIIKQAFHAGIFDYVVKKDDMGPMLQLVIEKTTLYYQEIQEMERYKQIENQLTAYNSYLENILEDRTSEFLKAFKKLKESETLFRSLVETSNDWIWQMNADGVFTYSSPKVEDILGYTPEETIGKSPLDFMSPKESKRVSNAISESRMNNKPFVNFENQLNHKDGQLITMETTSVQVTDTNGKILGYQGTNRDITEQFQLEKKIIKAVIETEEKERHRYAQDLHDGLSPLLSAAKLYINSLGNTDDVKHLSYAIDKTNSIIDEAISTIVEVSNNISPHVLINFGLEEAIKSSVKKIRSTQCLAINVDCKIDCRFELPIEASLLRVVNELIHNTIKHAQAVNVDIKIRQVENVIILTYQDDGIGFDMNEVKETKKERMGLINMNDRILSLGGSIDIVSAKEKGVKVSIEIAL